MYDSDDDFYDNYNEFDVQIKEFQQALIKGVKQQYLNKLNELTEENARLQDVADRMVEIEREHKAKLRELDEEKMNLIRKVRRERISELFSDQKVIMYRAGYTMIPFEKCAECDKDRHIHFLSPQGVEVKAPCRCNKSTKVYAPRTDVAYEINIRNADKRANVWYKANKEGKEDEYLSNISRYCDYTYKGEPFESLKLSMYELFFEKEEDCQRYCDWLNSKEKEK